MGPSREVFRADGTYVLIVYRDRACKIVVEETPVKWSVDHGVLTSIAPGGVVIRDEVLSIDARRMTLHSLDDGTTYTREKSEACADSPA